MEKLTKQDVKQLAYKYADEIEKMISEINAPACDDVSTGKERSSVIVALRLAWDKLKEIGYNIY